LGAGVEAFPLCAAGLVEVDVGVDEAGEEEMGGVVRVGGPEGEGCGWQDGGEYGGYAADGEGDDYRCGGEFAGDDSAGGGEDGDLGGL